MIPGEAGPLLLIRKKESPSRRESFWALRERFRSLVET